MDVQWRKAGPGFILVHEYMDEGTQDLPGEGYQTQTELFLQEFSSGNVSLKLKRLQVADAGKYHCFVRNPQWTLEATTELQVAAVAPVFIDVLGPRGQGIGLACRSTGWFPKPELQWVGKNQQNLAMEIVTNVTQDRENLYSVVSHVTVTEGEDHGDISCIVRNGLLETERQSALHLSLKRKASQKKRSKEEALLSLECQELRQRLDAERKAFESECQELRKTIESEEKKIKELESDCGKLHGIIASKEKKIKELESDFRRAQSYMALGTTDNPSDSSDPFPFPGALPAPTLYLSPTSAQTGDSVRLTCSVFSRTLATCIVFCKDGEEVSSQTGLVGKLTYDYDHVVSRHSSGNYSCGYKIKDSDSRMTKSQLSPAKHFSITEKRHQHTRPSLCSGTDVINAPVAEMRDSSVRSRIKEPPKIRGNCALRAPTLYLSQISARQGDSVLFQCSVISQALATHVVFCKDGEEVLSQMSSEERDTYDYDHEVSRGSTGKYACGYEIKDSDNRVNRTQVRSAKHLSITGQVSSSGEESDPIAQKTLGPDPGDLSLALPPLFPSAPAHPWGNCL
ncbi:Butyrophilin subfamily 3 member A2 [Chelonia mydas]|uniref:Butyrophilin subfamily 3 member A2 n=1 Tax=Chelonia mydas TaxID=8469 RepID=M7AMG3_CHEMY|nr:Butyrophilin subfamily 3 member A2 [Chelonia mydas]